MDKPLVLIVIFIRSAYITDAVFARFELTFCMRKINPVKKSITIRKDILITLVSGVAPAGIAKLKWLRISRRPSHFVSVPHNTDPQPATACVAQNGCAYQFLFEVVDFAQAAS
jgi:hypothetical protein